MKTIYSFIWLCILSFGNLTFTYNQPLNNAHPIGISLNMAYKIYQTSCPIYENVHPAYFSDTLNITPIVAATLMNDLGSECLFCPTGIAAQSLSSPTGIAITPNGKYAYVTNFGNNTVSIIDISTNKITCSSIPVGNNPIAVAITPDNQYIYVANSSDASISKILYHSNTVIYTFHDAVLTGPTSLVIDAPHHAMLITNPTGSLTFFYDTVVIPEHINGFISSGSTNYAAAVTPDGIYYFIVNNRTTSNIKRLKSDLSGALTTITAGTFHTAITITPDNLYAYITNNQSSSVIVINANSLATVATISVGTSPFDIAVTPNGQYVYVTNSGSDTVSVISTASNTVVATIPVGNNPYRMAITPNGSRVYVTNKNDNSISVISVASNTVISTIA